MQVQPEEFFSEFGLDNPLMKNRRQALRDTLAFFRTKAARESARQKALLNLKCWQRLSRYQLESGVTRPLQVKVLPEDWGVVTANQTQKYGACFAVLNMANSIYPGGGSYIGAPGQEEDMLRRTDCHYSLEPVVNHLEGVYLTEFSNLLNAVDGQVFLDTNHRTCVRDKEVPKSTKNYPWLTTNQYFPFYELRAAAQDLRQSCEFDTEEARRRIAAQFQTLQANRIRHCVLGAFGCGFFRNPADVIARIYREEITQRRSHFDIITFAICDDDSQRANFDIFHRVFADWMDQH